MFSLAPFTFFPHIAIVFSVVGVASLAEHFMLASVERYESTAAFSRSSSRPLCDDLWNSKKTTTKKQSQSHTAPNWTQKGQVLSYILLFYEDYVAKLEIKTKLCLPDVSNSCFIAVWGSSYWGAQRHCEKAFTVKMICSDSVTRYHFAMWERWAWAANFFFFFFFNFMNKMRIKC